MKQTTEMNLTELSQGLPSGRSGIWTQGLQISSPAS